MGFGGWVTMGSMFILVLVVMMFPILILPASASFGGCYGNMVDQQSASAPATFTIDDMYVNVGGDIFGTGTVTFEAYSNGKLIVSKTAQVLSGQASTGPASFTINQPGEYTISYRCTHSSGATAADGWVQHLKVTGSSSTTSNDKETVSNTKPKIRDCSDSENTYFRITNGVANLEIWGKVPEYKRGSDVQIIVTYQTGFIDVLKVKAAKDGNFELPLHNDPNNPFVSTLEVIYDDASLGNCQYHWKPVEPSSEHPDRDGDGIEDRLDSCRTQPETKNNYQDSDGCPDEPAPNIVFPSRVPDIIKEDVKFTQDGIFRANGCGGEKWWANVPDFDFVKSCNEHDFCYGEGGDASDRLICDEQLHDSIKKNSHLGSLAAWTYYYGVRAAGVIFFNCNEDLWIKCQ